MVTRRAVRSPTFVASCNAIIVNVWKPAIYINWICLESLILDFILIEDFHAPWKRVAGDEVTESFDGVGPPNRHCKLGHRAEGTLPLPRKQVGKKYGRCFDQNKLDRQIDRQSVGQKIRQTDRNRSTDQYKVSQRKDKQTSRQADNRKQCKTHIAFFVVSFHSKPCHCSCHSRLVRFQGL